MKTDTIKILGIDPGINHTGWNIGLYDVATGHLTISTYGTIEANTLAKKEMRQDAKIFGNVVSLDVYEREFHHICEEHNPDYIASEDAFYNPRTPNAYLSLKLCIHAIQRLLYHQYRKTLYRIPPTVAKQAVRGNGMANKLAVQESILALPDLTVKSTKQHPVERMVEHEADSIAITYTFCKLTLPDLLMQK